MEKKLTEQDYRKARVNKDKNYDGQFYFGVKTTKIFCCPSCPSPVAKEVNVIYFNNLYEAFNSSFRPCRRCHPDIINERYHNNTDGIYVVNTALAMIKNGYLNNHSVLEMAKELLISDRHLRHLFIENIGLSPIKIASIHKAIFAKKLILSSNISFTDVAYASGFRSVRQFNDVIKKTYGLTPSLLRKNTNVFPSSFAQTKLFLKYKGQLDFDQILKFMSNRLITGVELVRRNFYARTFRINNSKGYFTVSNNKQKSSLELCIECNDIECYMIIYYKVRKMFDLDSDYEKINKTLLKNKLISKIALNNQIPRLPVSFDPFEFTIRAILGQQISVKAATTLVKRIVVKSSIKTPNTFPEGLDYFFPFPDNLIKIDLSGLGITKNRQNTIALLIDKLLKNKDFFSEHQNFEEFKNEIKSIKGIGEWTAQYIGMRGLGISDCFPSTDLGVIKAISNGSMNISNKEIIKISEQWIPYRSYATLCLWNSLE